MNICDRDMRDCVGKDGHCDLVVSVDECKFDRSEVVKHQPKPFGDVVSTKPLSSCSSGCCDKATDPMKTLIDEVVAALIKYRGSL